MPFSNRFRHALLGASALVSAAAVGSVAYAADTKAYQFDMPVQPLTLALKTFGATADQQLIFSEALVKDHTAPALKGSYTPDQALAMLLTGSGLIADKTPGGIVTIRSAADPQSGSAAGDGADGTVAALVVTAQKREENIQDVPIAISAFTEKALEEQKIEGGFDLLKAIPNVSFSKNNFTSYNFSIRGIGTKAVSATTDPGVAVSFNNIALLQNRLFEQEYFDIERVEVLRGPQGTLYGRNATAGVVNVISAKPNLHEFSAWVKGEVGNYQTKRASGMVNVPLVDDKLAVRLASAWTQRDGFDFNTGTGHNVNGRDLWSGRLTIGFQPVDNLKTNLIWEHFDEDDNRSRTGKQLCTRDPGPTEIGGIPVATNRTFVGVNFTPLRQAMFSSGCKAGSLYDPLAFGTPNGLALPFVFGMLAIGQGLYDLNPYGLPHTLIQMKDPYGGKMQSPNLREINSFRDPVYRAKADVFELNIDWRITEALTFSSQTAYNHDQTYSFQDFNRFNTVPVFADTSKFLPLDENSYRNLAPGGVYCDPQLGCSNTLAGFDIAQAAGKQFTQELRLQSDIDGPLNFSVGANYNQFKTLVDYYVFYNLITAFAQIPVFNPAPSGAQASLDTCYSGFAGTPVPSGSPGSTCPYIDPNPVESINGEGHNYFRSKNPYKLRSAGVFGEIYWEPITDLKVTAGLRYNYDRKTFVPVPSQVLLAQGLFAGGDVSRGYPELPPIKQEWREWTGKLGVDWKPELSWTDQTMVYGSYSRGYKAGGANPPEPGFTAHTYAQVYHEVFGHDPPLGPEFFEKPVLELTGVDYEKTFEPEFVDAFEVGAKNTLLDGALVLNAGAFFYNYKDYQVSQIKNRTAVNENFDATTWGIELQSVFSPSRNLQFIANIGYLDSKIADGESSIDLMNRTQGRDDLVLARPWVQIPSNCVVPVDIAKAWLNGPGAQGGIATYWDLCGGTTNILDALARATPSNALIDPNTGKIYDPLFYNGVNLLANGEPTLNINGGAGIRADLGGNELPNAPHWTMNLGSQYAVPLGEAWKATVRGDVYWQSQSWARVYNLDPYDKLHGWYNLNLSVWFENDNGLKVELYAKNILDKTPITDAFLNSDDTALTTNVFTLDPRLIGLSVRKEF